VEIMIIGGISNIILISYYRCEMLRRVVALRYHALRMGYLAITVHLYPVALLRCHGARSCRGPRAAFRHGTVLFPLLQKILNP